MIRFRRRSKDPLNDAIATEARLFQEAWLHKHGLSRFARFMLTIFVSFIAATAFVQGNNREQCEAGKPLIKLLLDNQQGIAERQTNVLKVEQNPVKRQNAKDARESARAFIKVLKPGLQQDCSDLYPILPFVGI